MRREKKIKQVVGRRKGRRNGWKCLLLGDKNVGEGS